MGEPKASKMVRKPVIAVLNLSTAMSPLEKDQFFSSLSARAELKGALMEEKGVWMDSIGSDGKGIAEEEVGAAESVEEEVVELNPFAVVVTVVMAVLVMV